jgi:hypothetical protein
MIKPLFLQLSLSLKNLTKVSREGVELQNEADICLSNGL